MSNRRSSSAATAGRDTLRAALDDIAKLKQLSAAIGGGGTPSGVIAQFAGATAPSGWLLCDGSSLLRSAYPDLFAVIGTTYGAVDGTHFTLPDGRGRVLAGKGTNGNVATLGQSEGAAVGNRQTRHFHAAAGLGFSGSTGTTGTENQNHNHSDLGHIIQLHGDSGSFTGNDSAVTNWSTGAGWSGAEVQTPDTQFTQFANIGNENQAHNHNFTPSGSITGNVGVTAAAPQDGPAYLVVNHIIKT